MFPFMGPQQATTNGQPIRYAWARKNKDGDIVILCHCDCHAEAKEPRPDAVSARLCEKCADDAFRPWTEVVQSLVR